jgi:hypothetical protein
MCLDHLCTLSLKLRLQDTQTSNPNLDTLLVTSWLKHDTDDYIRALTGPYSSPRFVLDHVASPNKGGVLTAANYPPPPWLSLLVVMASTFSPSTKCFRSTSRASSRMDQ